MIYTRPSSGYTFLVAAFIFAILILWREHVWKFNSQLLLHCSAPTTTVNVTSSAIPNQVHYVYILRDADADFAFQFKHFLSLYSVLQHWHPDTIYLHTNANPKRIENARAGRTGKWSQLIFNTPNLRINHVEPPTVAGNGKPIDQIEHKSDFIRVSAVCEFGGIYLDWDAHPIRDIKVLRESGFNSVTGRQAGGEIMSGTFMAKKDALLLQMWKAEMHKVYDGGWTTHSNSVVTRLGQRLARLPGEVLIMEQDAFGPGSWTTSENILLYGIHNETESNLENATDCKSLPSYEEGVADRWDRPQDFPSWEYDYSHTYILHAFSPARNGNPVQGFEHITPKYVLERQSNFARLLYPVTRDMCHAGFVEINDPYAG
ncbi:hypothetical protein IFM61606_07425 [Aspergillus udagawae]|uniref:Glycosyl transferase n=1 Tax=Aspergillus udagawae TaxID=91492 RepID=A0ABQ1A6X9_9EURO|nr:hypothetical protein IFM53868_01461 [Aspergillus udagawae]GFG27393.1 hypothetical protein IFM61606_07425 [Aspergillus udagawae]